MTIHTDSVEKAWKFAYWRIHSDFYNMCILAGVQKESPDMYERYLRVTRNDVLTAVKVSTPKQNKLRAFVMWICPSLIPLAMQARKKIYHVKVND